MEATTTNQTERNAPMNFNDFNSTITEFNLDDDARIEGNVGRLYSDILEWEYSRDRILSEAETASRYAAKIVEEIKDGYNPGSISFLVGSPIDNLKEYKVKYEMLVERVRRSIHDLACETTDPETFTATMTKIAFS
jgi:hypothetical protein